jgi:hypothetical protein
MRHELARLAGAISWPFLEEKIGAFYSDTPGQPPLPTRLMAGLAILKHTDDFSDEELSARLGSRRGLQQQHKSFETPHRAPLTNPRRYCASAFCRKKARVRDASAEPACGLPTRARWAS